jgi:hypothetical protein
VSQKDLGNAGTQPKEADRGRGSQKPLPHLSSEQTPASEKSSPKASREYALDLPACHCSKGQKKGPKSVPRMAHVLDRVPIDGELEVVEYRNGIQIKFPSKGDPEPPEERTRASNEQSGKSRRRCAFTLGNAETNWLAMLTLTYRVAPESYEEVAEHRKRLLESMRKKWGKFDFAWFLEFTRKGTPHFHVFIGDGGNVGDIIRNSPIRQVNRRGKKTDVVGGDFEASIVRWWTRQVGDESEGFRKYQNGGIVELLRTPDAAGRYAAKEAGKRVQKSAPWPVRQWWYISDSVRPEQRHDRVISVKDYLKAFPDGRMVSTIYGKEVLEIAGFDKEC